MQGVIPIDLYTSMVIPIFTSHGQMVTTLMSLSSPNCVLSPSGVEKSNHPLVLCLLLQPCQMPYGLIVGCSVFLQDLEEFVQSSDDDGIVVFSFGSLYKNLTVERRDMFVSALGQIPQKVCSACVVC